LAHLLHHRLIPRPLSRELLHKLSLGDEALFDEELCQNRKDFYNNDVNPMDAHKFIYRKEAKNLCPRVDRA